MRSAALLPVTIAVSVLAPHNPVVKVMFVTLLLATFVLMLADIFRPRLGLRKGPPKPSIRLNIEGPFTGETT